MSISVKDAAPADGLACLYERDYYGWIQQNVHAIRGGRVQEVDWANVAEELEDMGKSEKRALRSQLARLISHLLKWSYQPERRQMSDHSWRATIEHARESVSELLGESPSLKPQLPQLLPQAYRDAVAEVVTQTNLPKRTFPADCPWTLDQMMAEDFWPEK